eukprot:Nitzschia sp. Nitz4//scaffold255_size41878//14143//14667//NITZ4_007401-RA/size41878-processed-gene-0.52-mRNA-1//1//CDS//3329544359//6983//frame0
MSKDVMFKPFFKLCGGILFLLVMVTAVAFAVVVPRANQITSAASTNTTLWGVQEDCNDPILRGPHCIEANLTVGECYDLISDRGFICFGDHTTYKNLSAVIFLETVHDIQEEVYNFLYGSSGSRNRDLVEFEADDVGVTFVDIHFTALQCQKTSIQWKLLFEPNSTRAEIVCIV